MSTHNFRALPAHPNLRHLKDQAKDLLKSGQAKSLSDAQFQLARSYGFQSWPKLKSHVESLEEVGQLKLAIDRNHLEQIKQLLIRNPELHKAPLGYANDGPLTMVAEWQFSSSWRNIFGDERVKRLEIAQWMMEHGSDVHQGGDAPLMRAALHGDRVPMMELLVRYGADVNALWHGEFPIIFSPCETIDPVALQWLLEHGANPNCASPSPKFSGTALDYVVGSYLRSEQLRACIEILLKAGGRTKYHAPPVWDILCGRTDQLKLRLQEDHQLITRRYPELDFGTTGGRTLTLRGSTLLHVAAEYQNLEAAKLLLDHGADVNAPAEIDEQGIGGQTPLFHAVTQNNDAGLPMAALLIERGANLSVRAKVPGYYERIGEILDCTALTYAQAFLDEPGPRDKVKTVAWLQRLSAI